MLIRYKMIINLLSGYLLRKLSLMERIGRGFELLISMLVASDDLVIY